MATNKVELIITADDQASNKLGGLTKSLKTVAKGAAVAGAAAIALGGAFIAMAKSTANAGDEVQKLSIRLGVSTEALSEYRHVAELSGVTFQNLSIGWQRQTRRIAEAAQGMGEAQGALKELGLEAESLVKLAPDEQFEVLAEAISEVATQSDKVRLAMKLWDSEGVSLLQTMEGGTEGIAEMRREAKRLGLTFTQLQADQAAAFNDSITRLGASFTGVKNTLAQELIPSLTVATEFLAAKIQSWIPYVRDFAKEFIVIILALPKIVKDVFSAIASIFMNVFTDWSYFKAFLDNSIKFWSILLKGMGKVAIEIGKIFLEIPKAIIQGREVFEDNFERMGEAFVTSFTGVKDILARVFDIPEIKALIPTIAKHLDEAKDLVADFADNAKKDMLDGSEETTAGLQTIWEKWFGTWTTIMEDMQALSQSVWDSFKTGVGDAVGGAIAFGEDLGEAFTNIFQTIVAGVISGLVQIGIERVAQSILGHLLNVQEATSRMAVLGAETYAGAFAAVVGTPFIGPAIAPGVAAASSAAMLAGATASAATSAATGATIAGVAHAGLENVPQDSTFLLKKGERVLSPSQNRDLERFLANGGGGITVKQLNFMPGARIDESLLNAPQSVFLDLAKKLLDSLNVLGDQGHTTTLKRRESFF